MWQHGRVTNQEPGLPEGEPYDWYARAMGLLEAGNPAAAGILLARLRDLDPASTSVLEAYARALFDTKQFDDAARAFAELAERAPSNDYAYFGLGLCLWRLQEFPQARDELAMATVMRPERRDYQRALGQVNATLRARQEAGLPLSGPVPT